MYTRLNFDDPQQQEGLRGYQWTMAHIQHMEGMGRKALPQHYDYVQRMTNWATSTFSPYDLNHLNKTITQMRPGWDMKVRQEYEQGRQAHAKRDYENEQLVDRDMAAFKEKAREVQNRGLTKTLAKGGLTPAETDELRAKGTLTRKGKAPINKEAFDNSMRTKTKGISRSGLNYREYLEAMEHLQNKTPGSKEWNLAVAANGLLDNDMLIKNAKEWGESGHEQLQQIRGMFEGTDDEVIQADDSALRRLDITESWIQKDPGVATPVTAADDEWISGGNGHQEDIDNPRADFAAAWDAHDADMAEYEDVLEEAEK